MRISQKFCFVVATVIPRILFAQTPTPVNLYVADLTYRDGSVQVSNPRKLTGDRGVNSQPSFSVDGKSILFVSRRDTTGQSDVYRIDLATGAETQVTRTPENENSPTPTADGGVMVIRWTPPTLFKEWGPWIYDRNGAPVHGVLPGPDTVGYYVRIDSTKFAMMRPKSRPAVALFDAATGAMTDYDWPVANLPPQLVPSRHAITYTRTDRLGHNEIRQLDLGSLQTSSLAPTIVGRVVHAWTPNGFILMGKGNEVFALKPGSRGMWKKVATLHQQGLQGLTTYVVNSSGDRVILISPLEPPLHQAIRDSLQAGRNASDVVAALRKAGANETSKFDVSESGIAGLGSERVQRGAFADAIVLMRYAADLFPKSYLVQMELGGAFRKSGDAKNAIAAYRRSLALNARTTADERAAAAAADKAIAELDLR